jgi:hypothetical protein
LPCRQPPIFQPSARQAASHTSSRSSGPSTRVTSTTFSRCTTGRGAVLVPQSGQVVQGLPAIREPLQSFLALDHPIPLQRKSCSFQGAGT